MTKTKKETAWSKLDHESKKKRLGELWAEGLSDKAIGDKLSATKGQIVGFRHTHLSNLTGETRQPTASPAPAEERQAPIERPIVTPAIPVVPVQELPRMPNKQRFVAEDTTTAPANIPDKLPVAASEKTQCDHRADDDNRRCAFQWSVKKRDGNYCARHEHLH